MTSEREFEVLLDDRLRALRVSARRRVRRQNAGWWSATVGVWGMALALAWALA